MWNYENKACNASDHEYQELWLWMTRLTLNAKTEKTMALEAKPKS